MTSTPSAESDLSALRVLSKRFMYDDVPHSLRFHWLFMEGRGRGTDMRHVCSPLRGLVNVQGNE